MPTQTITIKVPQKLKKDFMRFVGFRLRMKGLYPDINPADAILILVAKALTKEEENENHSGGGTSNKAEAQV